MTIEMLFLDGEEAVVEWQGNDRTYGSRHYVETAIRDGSLRNAEGAGARRHDRGPRPRDQEEQQLDAVADRHHLARGAAAQKLSSTSSARRTPIEDDHLPFIEAGVPAVDIIDLDFPAWHTQGDTLDAVSARSLQIVGDVVLAALPQIERRLTGR